MEIHSVIIKNRKQLEDLTIYPELQYLKQHTKIFDSLNGFYSLVSKYQYYAWRNYFLMTVLYIKESCQDVRNSIQTWQSHLILLHDMGFIERIRLSEETKLDTDEESQRFRAQYMRLCDEKKKKMPYWRPPTLVKVNSITDELLQQANDIAGQYRAAHAKYTRIDKQLVIEIRGQQQANRLYIDGRTIPQLNKEIKQAIVDAMTGQIQKYGYTTKKAVIGYVYNQYCGQSVEEQGTGVQQNVHYQEAIFQFQKKLNKYANQFKSIAANAGYKFGPVTKMEAEKFRCNMNTWVVR